MKNFLYSFRVVIFLIALSVSAQAQRDNRQLTLETNSQTSQKRTALVIGNGTYDTSPLRNPVNDATDIAAALRETGFTVTLKTNLNQNDMKRAIREFGQQLRTSDGIGLFYFAGHGVQAKGVNYLIPVGANVNTEQEVEYEAVEAGFVLAQMDAAQNELNIVILDACRNNPFARSYRSTDKGLAQMDAPSGTLIAYATAPGSVASDGTGRNGLYTQELLKNMRTSGLSIEEVFKRVRVSVRGATQGKQTPWEASSLVGDFYFTRSAAVGGVVSKLPVATTEVPKVAQIQINNLLTPFAKLMSEAFAKDYVGKSVKTKVQFIAVGQTQGWIFGAIPPKVMEGKLAFRVSEFEEASSSETPFGSVPPHIFIDKDKADLIFELKKGESIVITGAPVVGTQPLSQGRNYTQVIFVATSIERVK